MNLKLSVFLLILAHIGSGEGLPVTRGRAEEGSGQSLYFLINNLSLHSVFSMPCWSGSGVDMSTICFFSSRPKSGTPPPRECFPSPIWFRRGENTRGGHQHRQVGRMPDTDLIPAIWSKGVKYHIFSKNRRQRSCPLPRSLTNPISRDQIFHFQWKKIETYTSIFWIV